MTRLKKLGWIIFLLLIYPIPIGVYTWWNWNPDWRGMLLVGLPVIAFTAFALWDHYRKRKQNPK